MEGAWWMRATDELMPVPGEEKNQVTIALTGDGPKDRKIIRAIAGRYPQPSKKVLVIPEIVSIYGRGNRRTGRYSGFSALTPIKTYLGQYKISSFLVLLDYEYVNRHESLMSQVEQRTRENGFNLVETEQLSDQAFLLNCRDCAHDIKIRIVVSGNNRRIEENEASLINLHYNVNVDPEKNEIADFYRRNATNLTTLIERASFRNISIAFADLVAALNNIEPSNIPSQPIALVLNSLQSKQRK